MYDINIIYEAAPQTTSQDKPAMTCRSGSYISFNKQRQSYLRFFCDSFRLTVERLHAITQNPPVCSERAAAGFGQLDSALTLKWTRVQNNLDAKLELHPPSAWKLFEKWLTQGRKKEKKKKKAKRGMWREKERKFWLKIGNVGLLTLTCQMARRQEAAGMGGGAIWGGGRMSRACKDK